MQLNIREQLNIIQRDKKCQFFQCGTGKSGGKAMVEPLLTLQKGRRNQVAHSTYYFHVQIVF